MKYYFITYHAFADSGYKIVRNAVLNKSPISFIREKLENPGKLYYNYTLLNAIEITEAEYNEHVDYFKQMER